ncbi:unnamed protein product, partial [Discosporangium mesarthrocarpum]
QVEPATGVQGVSPGERNLVNAKKMAGAVATEVSAPLFSWDLVTVAQLVRPELFATREVQCDIIAVGPSRGRVVKTAGERK